LIGIAAPSIQQAIAQPAAQRPQTKASEKPTAELVRESAQRIKEYQRLLNDPDPTVRLAALDLMINSDDAVTRETGFEAGFSSADRLMRSLTLRAKILSSKECVIEIGQLKTKTGNQYSSGQRVRLRFTEVDLKRGELGERGDTCRVSGLDVVISIGSYTAARLRLGDDATLTGTLSYSGGLVAVWEATMTLN